MIRGAVLPRGGANLWIPVLAGLVLASGGVLLRRARWLFETGVRYIGLEDTHALSVTLVACGIIVIIAPAVWVGYTGRAVDATQGQALAAWDTRVSQTTSVTAPQGSEDTRMVLTIPRLGLRRFVPNDATPDQLKAYGVGWIPWTARPGVDGVVGIAGHRTTHGAPFFRLNRLAEGDQILIDYQGHRYTYRAERFETVSPTQVEILEGQPDRRMVALVTCTPAYSAAYRLVVMGRLEAAGVPGNGQ